MGVAMFAAALMICVPKMEIMIFSVSLNSSRKMLQMIKDFIEGHHIGKHITRTVNNKDKFFMEASPGDRRMCESRPGRGQVRLSNATKCNCGNQ